MGFNGNRIREVQVNVQVEGKFVWKRGKKIDVRLLGEEEE